MSDAKIVWDADSGRVDNKLDKTKEKVDQVGKAFKKWGSEISSTAMRLGSVVRIMGAIGDEIEKNQAKAIDASRRTGGGLLERGRALRELGLDAGADESIRGISGGASLDERAAFLGQLAGAQKSSKRKFSKEDINRAINLQAEGITSGDEIIRALNEGSLDKLNSTNAVRRSQLTTGERDELDDRDFERQQQLKTDEALTGGRSRALRRGSAMIEARDATNPATSGFRNVVGAVTGQDSFVKSGELATLIDMNDNLKAIRNGVQRTANGQPNLNTSPDGVP
jgi:hypothetical protein